MKMLIVILALAVSYSVTAKVHQCENIAIDKAPKLLRHHCESPCDQMEGAWIGDTVTLGSSIKSPDEQMNYDVLELNACTGYMQCYRMKFIFAVVQNECVLMGEEILNMASLGGNTPRPW